MLGAWNAARARVRASPRARDLGRGGLLACGAALLALLFFGSRAPKSGAD